MEAIEDGLLWHYTTLPVFEHIVRSNSLHATNIRHMNDAGEFSMARELFVHALPTADSKSPRDEVAGLLRDWARIAFPPEIYVASFSAAVDTLSQWRAYCKPGPGVAIGFDVERLTRAAAKRGFCLIRCEYPSRANAKAMVRTLIESKLAEHDGTLRAISEADPNARQGTVLEVARDIFLAFDELAVRLKHDGFSEEREYRLFSARSFGLDPEATVRARGGVLVPYRVIDFDPDPASFPIKRVWIGPTVDKEVRDLHLHALFILTAHINVQPIDYRFSETPLRG